MRLATNRILRVAAAGVAFIACSPDRIVAPSPRQAPVQRDITPTPPAGSFSAGPSVRISEFHYDHPGTDSAGTEKIEISGPAGTSLVGWQIIRYNGANPAAAVVYTSPGVVTLSGTIAQSCGTRGVIAFTYPLQDGLQNGPNDGFALVNPSNQVVELLSYEGKFVASNGPAAGMTSVDVGVSESPASGSSPRISIQRTPTGTWVNAPVSNFGACNDDDSGTAATVDHITVTPTPATVAKTRTIQFTATAKDASDNTISGVTFTWASGATASATVDASGLATGVAEGSATITATAGSVVGSASLTVGPAPVVTSITVSPATATVNQAATQQFTATAFDADNKAVTGTTFTWASSATSVATVNASGLATGVAGGNSNITATSGAITGTAVLTVTGAPPYTPPNIRFSELHYDNAGTDAGEAIEIEGPVGNSLSGWSIVLYEGNPTSATAPLKVYSTTALTGSLVAPIACGGRGALKVPYPLNGIQNGGTAGSQPDGFALVDNNGALVEFLSYEGSFTAADGPANGVISRDIGVMEDNPVPAVGLSLHRSADGRTWAAASAADMGYVNACGGPPPSSITFSGRSPTADPALPVGFEAQVFASEKVGGSTVNTTFTWTSETPDIASIDHNGVLRALAAGTAVLRATATDGATDTYSLPTIVATQSAAPYGGNTEFGDPVDADASDDFIIRRLEYTSSFNKNLGRPNWVSEKLDATAYGPEDRCNCFTFDPELVAAGFTKYTTADYTGAGAFAGYGIDRGHMTRSADRTASNLDNARTYYFSNVLPQAAVVNQGNWAIMENFLGDQAKNGGKEVYVMSGGAGSKGTVKNEGKIDMPAYVWKVAVIMGGGKGLADVHSVNDVQVIAVVIPNDAAQTADWTTYKVTVDSVEALTGYDLLSKLPDNIEKAVESNDTPPVAAISGATTGAEGSLLSFSAAGSTDADAGDVLTYTWTFGDGGTATGVAPSHTYADNGTYTVTVRATDRHDVYSEATLTTTITNVAPTAVLLTTPSSLTEGSNFTVSLNGAADPSPTDLASLTYAFDCGDGAGFHAASSSSSVSCATNDNGVRTVNARVMDKDGGATSYTGTVTVTNAAPVITGFSTPNGAITGAQVSVSFSDVGTADTHSVTFSWGDGQSSTVDAGLNASASATHTYAATGFYAVSATVTDDDGASVSTGTQTLVVYNPTGGTLSGSGFLLGGRGTKTYLSGSISYGGGTTPTGTFTITGNDAANLTSTSFDYLVVNGITATLKGVGTLTDGTPVTFLVRELDNKRQDMVDRGLPTSLAQGLPNQDYARIKVWNLATGAVVYDSQPGAADAATPTEMVRGGSFSIRP